MRSEAENESGNFRNGSVNELLLRLSLGRHLFQQILRRHKPIAQSIAHMSDGFVENGGDLVQSRQIVLVIFHRAQRHIKSDGGVFEVDPVELSGWHFPSLEARTLYGFAQAANHQRVIESLLLGEAADIKSFEFLQRLARVLQVFCDGFVGEIAERSL